MKRRYALLMFLLISALSLSFVLPSTVRAQEDESNTIIGKTYQTYLFTYCLTEGSVRVTFSDDYVIFIEPYDGFGLYMPVGEQFFAFFWSPNYNGQSDLFLTISGIVVADFIAGSAIVSGCGITLFAGYQD